MLVTSKRLEFSPEEVANLLKVNNWYLYMDDEIGTFHVIDVYESSMDNNQLIIYCEIEEEDDEGNIIIENGAPLIAQHFFHFNKGKTPIDKYIIYHLL